MKRVATIVFSAAMLVALASSAFAALRVPQIAVQGGTLQGYLNSQGESINVLTDQNAVQSWSTTVSNNSTFSLQIELAGNAASNSIGIYNAAAGVPALYQVFPGAAATGWFATASFRNFPTRVVVNLFDANAALQGTTTYLGADRTNFGYYLSGPGGTFYTQDVRNAGSAAQALTYAGNLESTEATVTASDTAQAAVHVNATLTATASGVAKIVYSGDAAVTPNTSGVASITQAG